jgi:RNA polymerase sigma factor (sigma-70 family)
MGEMTNNDMDLVREYAIRRSESAFAEVVERYTNLVYSAALRQVRNPQLAEEVTQVVFVILARKAGSLDAKTILPSWLYRAACYVSGSALKRELRRQRREQEAYMESIVNETDTTWEQLSPLLDEGMLKLGPAERNALLLRYFEGRSLGETGTALGTSEEAAKKRVSRALEKLRRFFTKRGVILPVAALTAAMAANSVKAAPAALAKSATAIGLAKGATASGATLTLIHGAMKFMAWTKLKIAGVVCVSVLLMAGTASVTMNRIASAREDGLWTRIDRMVSAMQRANGNYFPPSTLREMRDLPKASAMRPTHYTDIHDMYGGMGDTLLGLGVPAPGVLGHAYDIGRTHILNPELLPAGVYDFAVNDPDNQLEVLQKEVKKKFGLVGRRIKVETNVLVLTVGRPNAEGLQHVGKDERGRNVSGFLFGVERTVGSPMVDETGLKGRYYLYMDWDELGPNPDVDTVNRALMDKYGLQLTPAKRKIDMLVLEKAGW